MQGSIMLFLDSTLRRKCMYVFHGIVKRLRINLQTLMHYNLYIIKKMCEFSLMPFET